MVYLYWLWAFIVITPLILGLPFLSRNRVYRVATLFAGINVGIVTLWYFINLLRWGSGPTYADQLHAYFTHSLPSLYIASLVAGSTSVSRYYLNTSTRTGALFGTLGNILVLYILLLIAARLLEVLTITIKQGLPDLEVLSDIANGFLYYLTHPNFNSVVLISLSTFFALNGTAAAMRISDEGAFPKDEKIE